MSETDKVDLTTLLGTLRFYSKFRGEIPRGVCAKAADRIEEMQTLLKEVISGYDWCLANDEHLTMASVLSEAIADARAALEAKGET